MWKAEMLTAPIKSLPVKNVWSPTCWSNSGQTKLSVI